MINSVINEGYKGLQQSQRELERAAHDIASFNVQPGDSQAAEDQAVLPVEETEEGARESNIAEPLVELRRQELLFNANAKVISTAADTLGSLLDVKS